MGIPLSALAGSRHPSATAVIEQLVQQDDPPHLWSWLEDMHPHTQTMLPMLPMLHRRMRELSTAPDGRDGSQVHAIAAGIGRLGPFGRTRRARPGQPAAHIVDAPGVVDRVGPYRA